MSTAPAPTPSGPSGTPSFPEDVQPTLHDDFAALRVDYPILANSVYMNSNSMGAMHSSAREALLAYAEAWADEGVEAWEGWTRLIDETADGFARLFGAAPGQTTLNQNVSFFQTAVASGLDWTGPRNRVVIDALHFPGVAYIWEHFRALGAELVVVPSDDGLQVPMPRLLDAIDGRTAIVLVSHGAYGSGALLDIRAITARAREQGALTMVDVYQTLGVVPINAGAWDADMIVGGSHKWLCGGPGTAFLWAKASLRDHLRPRTSGWMGHASPFAFEPPPLRFAPNSWHFMGGTPSVPAYYVANRALACFHRLGADRIRRHNAALCQILVERALEAGLQINSPLEPSQRTGFVALDFPNSAEVSAQLVRERFKHDRRPGFGLRVGPHFYNTADEVHRFMDRLLALARR